MRTVRALTAFATVSLVLTAVAASAAPALPRAGCFLVADKTGDHTTWTPTAPVRDFILDPAYDLTGLNVGVTATTLTVYVSVDKLADRPTYGVDGWYETSLTVGSLDLQLWADTFGKVQSVRDALPTAALPPDPTSSDGQPIREIRTSHGARVRPTSATSGGTPVPVAVSLDLDHNEVTWTFSRSDLEKAFKKKLTPGIPIAVGTTRSSDNFGGLEDIEQDTMAGAVYRVGAKGCV